MLADWLVGTKTLVKTSSWSAAFFESRSSLQITNPRAIYCARASCVPPRQSRSHWVRRVLGVHLEFIRWQRTRFRR